MVISRTPTRLSFCGGGSDFPGWYRQHGGLVISTALNKFVYVSVKELPTFHDFKTKVVCSNLEKIKEGEEPEQPVVRAVLKHLGWIDGLEIFHQSDLPGSSGTGSSSSFVVGLLNALMSLKGIRLSAGELAGESIHIERQVMQESVGCQDQIAAAYGGFNEIRFHKGGGIDVFPVAISTAQVEDLAAHTLLFYTGLTRVSSHVSAGYANELTSTHADAQFAILRLAEQSLEHIYAGRWQDLARVIDLSWKAKMSLPGVCPQSVAIAYETARLKGAWGGKITGAGNGGCLLLLAPPEQHTHLTLLLESAPHFYKRIPVKFEESGSSIVFCDRKAISA